jgi:hypothetical protein
VYKRGCITKATFKYNHCKAAADSQGTAPISLTLNA